MTGEDRKAGEAAERVIIVCDVLASLLPPSVEAFGSDTRAQWAVEMGLIRIGEGVNRIPAGVLDRFPGQPWREIVAMRNFAAHQYDDLDPRRVWRTVTQDVPRLRSYLAETVIPGLDAERPYTAVMSYAASRELRPGRMRFPDISPRAYEHPADRGALVALRAIPGFDTVVKTISGAVGERSVRLLYLATSVRTSARQYPELHRTVAECATALDLHPIPELYITQDPRPDAMTIGLDKPIIVITTGMLELLEADGLRFVIGHEVGHVLSGHAIYRTMLLQLISISQSVQWIPLGAWGLRVIILALHEWFRKSELSADRAGLLCTQDPQAALKVHAAQAGALNPDDMDVAGFLDQAKEYQGSRDVRDSVLKLLQISGQTHPLAALRAAELQQWAAGAEYRAILAGDYPKRTDDKDAPMGEDVRAAASSYSKAFTATSDPLFGVIGKIGTAAGLVGGAAATRIRDWWQAGNR